MLTRRSFAAYAIGLPLAASLSAKVLLSSKVVAVDADELAARYPDLTMTFCVLKIGGEGVTVMNAADIDLRHTPWSTFKIPNLLIALETGIAQGLDHRRIWDTRRRPAQNYWPASWRQDQTLETAFRRSVPWYFKDVAVDIGTDRYRSSLARFGYGNGAVPENSDDFWLGGPLQISVFEQAIFLKRLLIGSIDVSARAREALHDVSFVRTSAGHSLYGKTGSGPLLPRRSDGPFEGWFVGWVEKGREPTVTFALYVQGPNDRSIRKTRVESVEFLLDASGDWPNEWR